MPKRTSIGWTDYSSGGVYAWLKDDVNPERKNRRGWFCDKPDAKGGCLGCYAEHINQFFGNGLKFDKALRDKIEFRFNEQEGRDLIKLNAKAPLSAKNPGQPAMIFPLDMLDLWQSAIPDSIRNQYFDYAEQCPNLTFQFLTKYPARAARYFLERYGAFYTLPDNWWFGMSAASQGWLDKWVPYWAEVRCRTRFLSIEPQTEYIDLYAALPYLNWVIFGGESGNRARPFDVDWPRKELMQLRSAGVKVFIKQLGAVPVMSEERWRAFDRSRVPMLDHKNAKRCPEGFVPLLVADKGELIPDYLPELQVREWPAANIADRAREVI